MRDRRSRLPAAVPGPTRVHAGGVLALTLAAPLVVGLLSAAPAHARPETGYEMPFPCGQSWTGSTRSGHSPSVNSIDWNRTDDVDDPVVASAAGTVSRVSDLGGRSYGLYVMVDHGGGAVTLHAHLAAEYVSVGQRLDQGQLIGRVGTSGGSSGPHLHYEQREGSGVARPVFGDTTFTMPSTQASANCPHTPVAGDWNDDGDAELGLYRRTATPSFRLRRTPAVPLGASYADPLVADWDGDDRTDLGVRDPATGVFTLRSSGGAVTQLPFGTTTDRGVAGDWDGDGRTEVGVFRPSSAAFLLRAANGTVTQQALGSIGSLPITGDWNGDGVTDLAVFDQGTWTLAVRGASPVTRSVAFGDADDLPASGDWDGDGDTDLGVWDPATATWTKRVAARRSTGPGTQTTTIFGRAR